MSTAIKETSAINGRTQIFAVFGHPVAHTLSPPMQNAGLQALGLNAVYTAFDVAPDDLMQALEGCRRMGFGGVNLTVPLKQVAFDGLSDLDRSAQRARAVNTIEFTESGMRGHNTDAYGFLTDVESVFATSMAGQRVAILGTGGAARGVALACTDAGCAAVDIFGRREAALDTLVEEMGQAGGGDQTRACLMSDATWEARCRDADVVIQCTSVGMKAGERFFASEAAFRDGQLAYDLVYTFADTVFMQAAAKAGARCANGLGMLLHQGARALSIWTGEDAPVEAMRSALAAQVYTDRKA